MQNQKALICAVLQGRSIDWSSENQFDSQELIRICLRNGVTGLYYYALKETGQFDSYPYELRCMLHKAALYQVAFEMHRLRELEKILDRCEELHIAPLILKGAALAYTHYSHPATRERCDTDLFVDFSAIEKIRRMMVGFGYVVLGPVYKSHQFTCTKVTGGIMDMTFDIHWRINNAARFAQTIDYPEALECAVNITPIPGARTLCPQHSLLLACLHLAASSDDKSPRLIWLYDIHLLLHSMDEFELSDFVQMAVTKKVQDICLTAIRKAQAYFETELSADCCYILSSSIGRITLVQRFKESNLGLLVNDFRVLPGMSCKMKLFKELFWPSPGELLTRYHKKHVFWIPCLYCRQIIAGAVNRLLLR